MVIVLFYSFLKKNKLDKKREQLVSLHAYASNSNELRI